MSDKAAAEFATKSAPESLATRSATGSAIGALWDEVSPPSYLADGLVEATGMPLGLAVALAGRGITKETVASFLTPKVRDLLPDPSLFKDMDKAVMRLRHAVDTGEHIGIFGDYDVDGAASAAILHDVLTSLGCVVSIHIPDRFKEGYGPNVGALQGLKAQGCSLIITVDCGITAHKPIEATVRAGVDVVIIDHHIPGPELPCALAVVNPNRLDDDGGFGYLAAAGVCFIVMVGLLRDLRQAGYFERRSEPSLSEPNLMDLLDLVALATVADVVPMRGVNRAFVRTGLGVMSERRRVGLARLADRARLKTAPDVYALGFLLAPRINAAGRLGESSLESSLGVRLLITKDDDEAGVLAEELEALNSRRQEIEQETTAAALAQIASKSGDGSLPPFVLAASEGWNQGVIGISAGRLREHTNRPSAVVSIVKTADGTLIGKGSGRSVAPFRLGAAVMAATQAGVLEAGGGHDMAAGFTLDMDKLSAFEDFMQARAVADFGAELGADGGDGGVPLRRIRIDAALTPEAASLGFLDWVERAGPFGTDFEPFTFIFAGATLSGVRKVGQDEAHISVRIGHGGGGNQGGGGGTWLEAIAFRASGTPLGDALLSASDGRLVRLVGRLNRNHFRGRSKPQLLITDIEVGC